MLFHLMGISECIDEIIFEMLEIFDLILFIIEDVIYFDELQQQSFDAYSIVI